MPEDNRPSAIKNAAPGVVEATDVLRQKAFKMRWEEKMTYEAIGLALGVSRTHAFRLANAGWAELVEDTDESRKSARALEIQRLEELIASLWDMAICDLTMVALLAPEAQLAAIENQIKAHGAISRHIQTICRLSGTYAPLKIEVKGGKRTLEKLESLRDRVIAARDNQVKIARSGTSSTG